MKTIYIILASALVLASCGRKKEEISLNFMNGKCTVALGDTIKLDGFEGDSVPLVEVDSLMLLNLIDTLPEDFSGKIYYHGKRKMGKLRVYSLLLVNGTSKTLHLVFVKGRLAISNREVAGNGQAEGYTFDQYCVIPDDSTITTRRFESVLSDEPSDQDEIGDSIITVSRLTSCGHVQVLKADTISISEKMQTPNDEEYAEEPFFYEGMSPSSWKTAGITDPVAFKNFFMELRNMVKLNDKDQIANHIKFPINGIPDEETFVKNYNTIFTQQVKQAILEQKIRQMFRDGRGVMIGNEDLWIKQINGQYKIVSIKK